MGWWQVSADTLAQSRFVVSPLAETIATMKALERGTAAYPGDRAWLDERLPAYRARLAADPVTARIIRAALAPNWNADFLTPTPDPDGEAEFEDELCAIRDVPAEAAIEHLAVALGGPVPPELRRPDVSVRAAGHLHWVWTWAVRPDWPRRRRIIEADIVARTAQLGRGGWAGALADLRPGMRWLGGSRLQVNTFDYPPRDLGGARLMFVPVTPRHGWVAWDDGCRRFAAVYPCSGALAGTSAASPEALGRLLGPARAGVLVLLDTPKSTTHLVALTGQGLGSVGRHLKVLMDARLIERRRTGRSVLYYRTDIGDALVTAQRDE